MVTSPTVRMVLRQLRSAGSPVERMKLLALGWRTVQRLSPQERKELASALGLQEVEGLLEKLGRKRDGIAPAELLRALEQADDLSPSRLRDLLEGLKDPERRKDLLRRGLEQVQDQLAADDRQPAAAPPAEDTPGVPAPSEVPAAEQPAPSERAEADATEGMAVDVERPEPAGETAPVEYEPPPLPSPRATPGPPAVEPLAADAWTVRLAPTPESAPVTTGADVASSWRPTAEPPLPGESVLARLRRFRQRLERDRSAFDTAAMREVLDRFPEPWARRRVLTALVRAGLPPGIHEALDLIETLERPSDRRWCAAALIDTRRISESEARELLERFPFPALRRRLGRRASLMPLAAG